MKNDNKTNRLSDLIDNDEFMDWIANPTPEKDKYWNSIKENDAELSEYIQSLKTITNNIQLKKKKLPVEDKLAIWTAINNHKPAKNVNLRRQYLKMASVAAVMIGMVYVMVFREKSRDINYQSMLTESAEIKQTDNIAIILDNQKQVKINSNNANVTYDNNGKLSVNSKTIAKQEKDKTASINQLIVPFGKTASLTLSDGSRIWVNSGSKLIYPSFFAEDKREIYIQGEAYIEVAKDKKPFYLKSEKMDIQVLGTKFNISAYKDDNIQSVVLVSGSVSVNENLSRKLYKIKPNQMYSLKSDTNESDIQEVDVNKYISWKSGFLIFKEEKLEVVLNKLQRFYNLSYLYNPDEIKDIKVGGKLNLNNNINDVFRILSITTPINYTIKDKTVEIKVLKNIKE